MEKVVSHKQINLEKIIKYTLIGFVIYKVLYFLDMLVQSAFKNAEILQQLLELFQKSRLLR